MTAQQQLVSVDDISEDNAPLIYVSGGLKPFIDRVREEVSGEVPDLSTKKGRDRIASLAAKVSKSKVAVEKPGREYLKRLKEMPKVVEAELRGFVTDMDALRDEVRKPLTDWEAAEAARVAEHKADLESLRNTDTTDASAAMIKSLIADMEAEEIGPDWEEFEAEAHRVKAASLATLREALVKREQYEAEQAELERLRAEREAQAQREREAQLVREAEERARREAEQAAQAEREAVIRREAEAKARELYLKQQAEAAEREKAVAEQRAMQAEIDAQAKAEQAAAAERQRYLDEQREAAKAAALREADQANRAAVNRAAMDAFIAGGLPEECAKQAVILIAKKQIPNITISY